MQVRELGNGRDVTSGAKGGPALGLFGVRGRVNIRLVMVVMLRIDRL